MKAAGLKEVSPAAAAEDAAPGRREAIITAAARLFSARGFEATTIRDIATAAGIIGGSVYYHFASKEEIFLAVHSTGVESMSVAVRGAIRGITNPWDKLEAAAVAHCEALLSTKELPLLVSPHFAYSIGDLAGELTAQRDTYEKIFSDIINNLDLPRRINRKLFRLHFLGGLNWAVTWYRPGGSLKPSEIGRQLVNSFRCCSVKDGAMVLSKLNGSK